MSDTIRFDVKNWTIEQLLDLDPIVFNSLNKRELTDVVSRLARVSNQRLNRIKKAGLTTPATFSHETGGYISSFTGGKRALSKFDLNQLRRSYVRNKNFLDADTSTVRGGRKWVKNSIAGLKEQGIELTSDEFDLFWRSYELAKDTISGLGDKGFKYALLDTIKARIDRSEFVYDSPEQREKIARYVIEHKDDIYKNYQTRQREYEELRAQEIREQLSRRKGG